MNFDADRLARLSGLGGTENTGVLTESKAEVKELEESDIDECCGCYGDKSKHVEPEMVMTMTEPAHAPTSMVGHSHDEPANDSDMYANDSNMYLFEMEEEEAPEEAPEEEVEESAALTMETLRDTVLELRNEILAEQAEERQALAEAPVRTAIRREIKALLAEMPADAATNWIYGEKGKPTASNNKSRATALAGVGFENSKH